MGEMEIRKRQLVHRLKMLGRSRPETTLPPTASQATATQPKQAPMIPQATFLHRAYAEGNADVAQAYGKDDDQVLKDHFDRYGARENRGVAQGEYINLEGVVACEDGHFFLSGWADTRVVQSISIVIEIGYLRYDLGPLDVCWYYRGDVSAQTGDTTRPSGFIGLVKVPDIQLHSDVRVLVNGKKTFEHKAMRWRSVDQFLTQTLNACAVLADQPIGATLECAAELYDAFNALWTRYLEQMTFAKAFEHRTDGPVDQSIIVTIYKSADMLIAQLEGLAEVLCAGPTELIIVGNALQASEKVVAQLRGFCQIHDVRVSLYLCSGNSGFSAANNFGAQVALGETLIFMNPDIFPPETAPETALGFLTSDPGNALHGALLYYGDGLLMHSGMYVASDLAVDARMGRSEPVLRVEHFGKGLSHTIEDDSALLEPVMEQIRDRKLLVTAALWKIRKSLFEEMGGLSTDYIFAYYEDADFCLRLLQAGHDIKIDETARWIHMEGVGKAKPPFVRSFMWLNRALFTRRFRDSDLVASDDTDLFQL